MPGTEPTKFWQEGAWSEYRGYPEHVTFFEQRFAAKSQTIHGSVTGNFSDFEEGSLDDQAFSHHHLQRAGGWPSAGSIRQATC